MRLRTCERWIAPTIAFVLVAATASTQTHGERALTVRMYNAFSMTRNDLATAGREAKTIFRDAGVHVVLRECRTLEGPSATSVDTCGDVLQPTEVMVRIVAAPRRSTSTAGALGYSLVDMQAGAGMLSTVFADRITAVAVRLQIDRATLLGRTLAHEIGHLLLGTNAHATDGLMRGDWPDHLLRAGTARDWRFSRPEVNQIATALVSRVTAKTTVLSLLVPAVRDDEAGEAR